MGFFVGVIESLGEGIFVKIVDEVNELENNFLLEYFLICECLYINFKDSGFEIICCCFNN